MTLLINYINPTFSSLHPETYYGGKNNIFLIKILQPLLLKIEGVVNVRCYLTIHETNWSSNKSFKDNEKNLPIYQYIRDKILLIHQYVPPILYPLFKEIPKELPFDSRLLIYQLGDIEKLIDK